MSTPECGCDDLRRATVSRRQLLAAGLGAGAVAALGSLLTDTRFAYAASGDHSGDVFVLLSLRGGFDGLSAVVPAGDPAYYAARPDIAIARRQLLGASGIFGLNPALAPLLPLWKGGALGAIHAVGQPAPNRSHFAAMEELERAAPGTSIRTGWLNRMLGSVSATDPMAAVSVGSAMPARVLNGPAPYLGLTGVDAFTLSGDLPDRPMAATLAKLYANAPAALAGVATKTLSALDSAKAIRAVPYAPANGVTYPATDLGRSLSEIARLIKSNRALISATVDCGDWDMHENLGAAAPGKRMYDHLHAFALALAAFATDLGPDGLGRVTLVTISEFGRRVAQNGSGGLDHGYGNAMFVLGGNVNGGKVHGRWPGLAPGKLVNGDLAVTSDYRSVIAELLTKRCGMPATAGVFPGVSPSRLGIVRPR
jgi:uncharacterized protein (DUF1501 family)